MNPELIAALRKHLPKIYVEALPGAIHSDSFIYVNQRVFPSGTKICTYGIEDSFSFVNERLFTPVLTGGPLQYEVKNYPCLVYKTDIPSFKSLKELLHLCFIASKETIPNRYEGPGLGNPWRQCQVSLRVGDITFWVLKLFMPHRELSALITGSSAFNEASLAPLEHLWIAPKWVKTLWVSAEGDYIGPSVYPSGTLSVYGSMNLKKIQGLQVGSLKVGTTHDPNSGFCENINSLKLIEGCTVKTLTLYNNEEPLLVTGSSFKEISISRCPLRDVSFLKEHLTQGGILTFFEYANGYHLRSPVTTKDAFEQLTFFEENLNPLEIMNLTNSKLPCLRATAEYYLQHGFPND